MNERELDLALGAIGDRHVRPTAPPSLRESILTVPVATPQQRSWLPTFSGRIRSLFSAAKFAVAGVVVALFGGFLLAGVLTQPSVESVPEAATAAAIDPEDPRVAVVTGHFETGWSQGPGVGDGRLEVDDARLSGDVTFTTYADGWKPPTDPAGEASLWWGSIRIENDGGTWDGTQLHPHQHALRADANPPVLIQLVGSGDYEGLSAILYWYEDIPDSGDPALKSGEWMTGMIFPGDLPPDRQDSPDY